MGSRLGLARLADSTLHVYINGEDQGVACDGVPPSESQGRDQGVACDGVPPSESQGRGEGGGAGDRVTSSELL